MLFLSSVLASLVLTVLSSSPMSVFGSAISLDAVMVSLLALVCQATLLGLSFALTTNGLKISLISCPKSCRTLVSSSS